MKCLTRQEAEQWLASRQVQMDEHKHLQCAGTQLKVTTSKPDERRVLAQYAAYLAGWLPCDTTRMLWVSGGWDKVSLNMFEKMRKGFGESRSLTDAPGHLFEASDQENCLLTGFAYLMMACDWCGYIVPECGNEFVFLGDEHVVFSSTEVPKIREVSDLVAHYGLKVIEDFEAWV